MIKKHVCIVLFVLLGVLFALSSCSESGTETPDSALSRRTLAYDPVVATVGDPVSISPEWTPILATPGDVTYSITPPLDEATTGLRFDTITGVISGTPLAVLEQTPYVITASAKNPGSYTGTQTSNTVRITILLSRNLVDYGFGYSTEAISVAVGAPANASPEWTTAPELPDNVIYSIENADGSTPLSLPEGLTFNGDTGVITGEPTEAVPTQQYTITATGSAPYTGAPEVNISITVVAANDIRGFTLSYNAGKDIQGVVNRLITKIDPTWDPVLATPGDVTYSITPPLDEATTGLRFDTTAGSISGTPTNVTATGEYTITATAKNPGSYTGTQTATINITIKPSISTYKFSYPIATGALGDISGTPRWDDSTPGDLTVTYSIESIPKSPEDTPIQGLPTGLNLNTNTGSITGSFTSLTHVTAYKVIANGTGNYGGSTSAVFLDTLLLEAHTPSTEGTAISTREDLEGMAADGTYHLTNHIDLGPEPTADPGSTEHYWTPLFSSDTPFTGTLHGNGYAIYNLKIEGDTANYQGLFAALGDATTGATVKNLGIGVGTITGGAVIGALAGQATDSQLTNITSAAMNTVASDKGHITANGTVSITIPQYSNAQYDASLVAGLVGDLHAGSTLTGNSIGLSISGIPSTGDTVGGLVGRSGGTIRGYATGVVNTETQNVGGLVGWNTGTVIGYTTGAVSGGSSTGGLVGYNLGGTITGYATGAVKLNTGNQIGGLVGYSTGTVTGYATASVAGASSVGGLVGHNKGDGIVTGYASGPITADAGNNGGLVGYNDGGTVIGYATGSVAGKAFTGGFVGYNDGGTVIGYWDQDATNQQKATSLGSLAAGAGVSATRNIAYNADSSSYTDTDSLDGRAIFTVPAFTDAFTLPAKSKTWPKLSASSMTFEYTVDGTQKVFTLVQPTIRDVCGNSGDGDGIIEVDMPTQNNFEAGCLIP